MRDTISKLLPGLMLTLYQKVNTSGLALVQKTEGEGKGGEASVSYCMTGGEGERRTCASYLYLGEKKKKSGPIRSL